MNNTEALGIEKISKLVWKLAIPSIIAQLVNLVYNLVDRMYIGNIAEIGQLALTGVGVTLPVIMIISSFAALICFGSASKASIALGSKDIKRAERILGNSFTLLMATALILTLIFRVFGTDILLTFGASENTIAYALDYMNIYVLGTVFVQIALGLNVFITAQGFPKISMLSIVLGAGLNIILDPIFIFVFDMGVSGAAVATVISQAASAIWILRFLFSDKATIKITKESLRIDWKVIGPCLLLGISPFVMQSTESILSIAFNQSLLKYGGDLAVGSMTVINSVMQLMMLPIIGLTQGVSPIISYNFGANKLLRVKDTFKYLIGVAMLYTCIFWVVIRINPEMFVMIFNQDPVFVEFASNALLIYMAATFMFGIQMSCQQAFVAVGKAKISMFLALLRKIILLIPLIYILPNFFEDKTSAVFLAEPIADFISASIVLVLFIATFKHILILKDNEVID